MMKVLLCISVCLLDAVLAATSAWASVYNENFELSGVPGDRWVGTQNGTDDAHGIPGQCMMFTTTGSTGAGIWSPYDQDNLTVTEASARTLTVTYQYRTAFTGLGGTVNAQFTLQCADSTTTISCTSTPIIADRKWHTVGQTITTAQDILAVRNPGFVISLPGGAGTQSYYFDNYIVSVPGTLDVTQFGAKGDNATDDTAAIQSVFNMASPGQKIYFPPRRYVISDTLTLDNKTGVTITMRGGYYMISEDYSSGVPVPFAYDRGIFWSRTGPFGRPMMKIQNCTNTTLSGLHLSGMDRAQDVLVLDGSGGGINSDLTAINCYFRSGLRYGLYVGPNQGGNLKFYRSAVTNCGSLSADSGADVFLQTDQATILFDTCLVLPRLTGGKYCVYITRGKSSPVASPLFRNCCIDGLMASHVVYEIVPDDGYAAGVSIIGGHTEIPINLPAIVFLHCNNTTPGRTLPIRVENYEAAGYISLNIDGGTNIHLENNLLWGLEIQNPQATGELYNNNITSSPGHPLLYNVPVTMTSYNNWPFNQ